MNEDRKKIQYLLTFSFREVHVPFNHSIRKNTRYQTLRIICLRPPTLLFIFLVNLISSDIVLLISNKNNSLVIYGWQQEPSKCKHLKELGRLLRCCIYNNTRVIVCTHYCNPNFFCNLSNPSSYCTIIRNTPDLNPVNLKLRPRSRTDCKIGSKEIESYGGDI